MAENKNLNNRIAQQVILFSAFDTVFQDFLSVGATNRLFVEDVNDKASRTPEDIKRELKEAANQVFCTKEDIQKFVNSLDSFTLSFLVPFINFVKPVEGAELRLHLFDINRKALKNFIDRGGAGTGSVGQGRETPGGVGVQKMDIEYLVNQESGYFFTLYKIGVDIFFNSMEDVVMDINAGGKKYTPVDVLIASTQDINKYLLQNGSNLIVSNLYRTFIEVGYSYGDRFLKEDAVREAWGKIVSKNRNMSFDSFLELIKKMKYVIEAYLYKWTWDVQENGNIVLHLDYYGSDRGAGSTSFSNILTSNKNLEEFNKLADELRNVEGNTEADKKRKTEKLSKQLKDLKEEAMLDALSGFFEYNARKGKTRILVTKSEVFEKDFSKGIDYLDRFFLSYANAYSSVYPLDVGYKGKPVYDFKKILGGGGERESQTTVTNKAKEVGKSGDSEFLSKIPFFYLGDMIDFFTGMALTNLTEKGDNGSCYFPPGSMIKIKLGYLKLIVFSGGYYQTKIVPISSIPISWDLFLYWWSERVERNPNLVYKYEEFLSDFFGYFFGRALSFADDFGLKTIEIGNFSVLSPQDFLNSDVPKKLVHYIYTFNREDRTAIRFYIGNRSGLMKTCKFSAEQDAYLSSFFMASTAEGDAPENNLQNQRAIYNINVDFFGNSLIQPGMLIEIVPTIVGADPSVAERFKNLYDLGIGGLYNVVSSKVTFQNGEFTSSVHAKYFGKPFNQRIDMVQPELEELLGFSREVPVEEQKSREDEWFAEIREENRRRAEAERFPTIYPTTPAEGTPPSQEPERVYLFGDMQ